MIFMSCHMPNLNGKSIINFMIMSEIAEVRWLPDAKPAASFLICGIIQHLTETLLTLINKRIFFATNQGRTMMQAPIILYFGLMIMARLHTPMIMQGSLSCSSWVFWTMLLLMVQNRFICLRLEAAGGTQVHI